MYIDGSPIDRHNDLDAEPDLSYLSSLFDRSTVDEVNDTFKQLGEASANLATNGDCPLVYTHPENIICPSKSTRSLLFGEKYQPHVVACVVDEAHCVVDIC